MQFRPFLSTILLLSVSMLLLSSCGAKKTIRTVAEVRVEAQEAWNALETKEIPNKSTRLREAIDFADMVIQYVNDGSGTKDLIDRARNNLQEALKSL